MTNSRIKKYKKRVITDEQVFDKQMENLTSPNIVSTKLAGTNNKPYTMTELKLQKFFEAISVGASYDTSCNYSGINKTTFYTWVNKAKDDIIENIPNSVYVDFMSKLHKFEADYEVNLLKDVQTLMRERDPFLTHVLKYMSIKFPKKWGIVS